MSEDLGPPVLFSLVVKLDQRVFRTERMLKRVPSGAVRVMVGQMVTDCNPLNCMPMAEFGLGRA
jgi:hypothetical protein